VIDMQIPNTGQETEKSDPPPDMVKQNQNAGQPEEGDLEQLIASIDDNTLLDWFGILIESPRANASQDPELKGNAEDDPDNWFWPPGTDLSPRSREYWDSMEDIKQDAFC